MFPKLIFPFKGREPFYSVCVTQSIGQAHALTLCFSLPVLQHQKVCSSPEASGSKRKQDKKEKAEEKR